MIFNFSEPSKYLYHYTRFSTASESILSNGTLRFQPYTNTNDPKESKQWLFDACTYADGDLEGYDRAVASTWLSSELKSKTLLSCLSKDAAPLTGDHLADIFHRGFCKPRMWAQYGEDHRGVCLVFDREKLIQAIRIQFGKHLVKVGDVAYSDQHVFAGFDDGEYTVNLDVLSSIGRSAYPKWHVEQFFQQLFFKKMEDWKGENEWRAVVFSDSALPLDLKYGHALAGVVFGADTTLDNRKLVISLTKHHPIHYSALKWKNCGLWYDLADYT